MSSNEMLVVGCNQITYSGYSNGGPRYLGAVHEAEALRRFHAENPHPG